MAEKDITTKQEDFDLAGQAVFMTLASAIKMHPAVKGNPIAEGTIDVVFPMMGIAVSRTAYTFIGERLRSFSEAYAKPFGNDPKRLHDHAAKNEESPDYHEVLYRGFRFLQDAVAPEVIPKLGILAAQYNLEGKKADTHFRALGRLLCDLETGELAQLQAILEGILGHEESLKEVGAADVIIDRPWNGETVLPSSVDVDFGHYEYGPIGHFDSAEKLFLLLKREGFAVSREARKSDKVGSAPLPDDALCIEFDVIRLILTTIGRNDSGAKPA